MTNEWADAMRDLSERGEALLTATLDGLPAEQLDKLQDERDAAYYRALGAGLARIK